MYSRNTTLRIVIALALLTGSFLTAAPANANDKVYARTVKSTVLINAGKSFGCGALIDAEQRLVVTANHVVGEEKEANVFFAAFDTEGRAITTVKHYAANEEGLKIKGTVVARLERCDLALLRLDSLPTGVTATRLAPQSARPGQEAHVLGHSSLTRGAVFNYSGGGKVRNVADVKFNLTLLNVEGKPTRSFEGRIVETAIVTREGDSGGPVVNDAGELVGVVSGTVGGNGKEKEYTELQVNMSIDVSEVRTLLKAGGFNAPTETPVVKAKPTETPPAPTARITQKPSAPPAKGTSEKPQAATLVGGVWKGPVLEGKGGKFSFRMELAADGTFRFIKVSGDGTLLQTVSGQYELVNDQLTLKVDGKVWMQVQVRLVDASRMTAQRDGGEAVTWRR